MLVGRWKYEREDGESMEELEFAPSPRRPGWILDLDSITSTSTLHHQVCKPHQRALQFHFHRSNLLFALPAAIMAPSRPSTSWLSSTLAVYAILCLSLPANALYFYVDGRQTRCFYEELPKDTLVVGKLQYPQRNGCSLLCNQSTSPSTSNHNPLMMNEQEPIQAKLSIKLPTRAHMPPTNR